MTADNKQSQEFLQLAKSDALKALSLLKASDHTKSSDSPDVINYDGNVINAAIKHVRFEDLSKAVALIEELKDDYTKQEALSNLARLATSYDFSVALEIANLCDSYTKTQTLASIATNMIDSDIETAKQIAQSIEHFPSQIGVMASIAAYMEDEEEIEQLLQIEKVKSELEKGCNYDEALINIVCAIAYNFPEKAIGLLNDIQINQIDAIIGVAVNLKDTDRGIELIRTSLSDEDDSTLSFALGMMAEMVAKTDIQKAMALIEEMRDEDEKEQTLLLLREAMK